jgi:SAM-dependent methyltransferase
VGVFASLAERSTEPELLDEGVDEAEAVQSLADLRWVNRHLGGQASFVETAAALLPPNGSLLDVGCGSADLPAALRARRPDVTAVGLDLKTLHLRHAAPGIWRVAGDAARPPFRARSFDLVSASLFLHHVDAPDLPRLLGELWPLARVALVVNDLHRARVPFVVAHALLPLALRSPVSVNDGLVSIRRSFRPAELRAAFRSAGIPDVQVERRFPYRLLAVARRAGA